MTSMLVVPVVDETNETTECAGGCGQTVSVDDDNWSNGQAYCGRVIGDSGYFCDDCFPRCYCNDCDSDSGPYFWDK